MLGATLGLNFEIASPSNTFCNFFTAPFPSHFPETERLRVRSGCICESGQMEISMCKLPIFKRLLMRSAAVLGVMIPAAAFAATGYATAAVNLRAGPGTEYPVVDTIPADAHVDIHGCLDDHAWCDVSWNGDRGWVSATYLDYLYNNQYVYLPDYVVDVPVVTFALDTYWGDYYRGRPWYGRLAYWRNFWRARGRYGFFQHEPGTNFERTHRVQQGEQFRNPHEAAGNGVHQHFVGRQFQHGGGRTIEHAPGSRHVAVGPQFVPHFHHETGGARFVNRGQNFERMGGGLSARASVGGPRFGGGGGPHFGGGGGPHIGGGGGPHFGGGGHGRRH